MVTRLTLILAAASLVLLGQSPRLEFEVASVKPSAPERFNSFSIRYEPGARAQLLGAPLQMLLMQAYDLRAFQIVGGADWVRNDRWDIEAKAPAGQARFGKEERASMLQALIADRFHLKAHQESRQLQIYSLEVTKGGSKLGASFESTPEFRFRPGSLRVKKGSTSALCTWLSRQLGREVIDRTGLRGEYDYALDWTPELGESGPESLGQPSSTLLGEPPPPAKDGPSIFTALQDQIGLRLVASRGPVRVLVIENAEKPDRN